MQKKDKEKVKSLSIDYIKELNKGSTKRFILHDPRTIIEIIYEGEISGDGVNDLKYEEPQKLSQKIDGVPFLILENLIKYKLSSGLYGHARYKDFDHIYELIKRNNLPKDYAKAFRKDLKKKYLEIWSQTIK